MSLFQVTKKQVVENYELRTMTGDIVSFTPSYSQLLPDPFSDLNVECNVVATQSGSGTPYPPGGGKNKFDKSTVNPGALINGSGNYVSYLNNNVSDYTPVVEGVGYYLYGITLHPNTLQDNFELFDGSKTKVGYANVKTNEYPYTIPSGVKFVRFTVHDDDLNTAMFATSEGEYEPYSNVRPINGYTEANITRCGVNLWDEEWELGYYNGAGAKAVSNTCIRCKNQVRVSPNTTYYIKTPNQVGLRYYDYSGTYISGTGAPSTITTFTTPSGAYYMTFYCEDAYGTTYNNDISINYPSTDTTYHAYNGQTYTIAFGQTVYGGVLDVTRGKLHVTHGYVELADVNFTNFIAVSKMVYGAFPEGTKPATANDKANILCSHYKTVSRAEVGYSAPYTVTGIGIDTGGNIFVTSPDSAWTSVSDAVADFSGVYMAYELATPFDIDLTPEVISAIVGTNNVFADCGETTVTCLI